MLEKSTNIFVSLHQDDERRVSPTLEQVRAAGWHNIDIPGLQAERTAILESIRQSGMVLIFLSRAYVRDERLMLEEFAYAATVTRKPFIPVWLDSLEDIQQDYQNIECDRQLLSALEMLTAKYSCTAIKNLIGELEGFTPDDTPYTPSSPQVCDKPCEAYEGDEPYIFISYAHDDAKQVYPIVKELYESGRDLWYDEGIKVTERYLPVIADHVRRCSVFVLMLTNRCLDRPFVMNYELEYARRRGIPIIPVLLEELSPQPWSAENAARLEKTRIRPDALLERIGAAGLPNRGTRTAVPPAIKQNVVYDVNLPPEMPGFRILVHEDEITITRYVGNDRDVSIPAAVESADGNITFRVTGIGDYAFTGGGLMSKDSFKKIDKGSLKKCKLIKSVVIPEGITSIGKFAFSDCRSLANISIPNSVTSIGESAFWRCTSLNNIIIPDSITSISEWVFWGCKNLTSVVLSESVTSIEPYAFSDCKSLAEIKIPDSVKNIDVNTFSGCESLTSINIPNSVMHIGREAFSRCRSLKNVILPDSIEDVEEGAFSYCPQLEGVFNTGKTTIFSGPQKWNPAKPYSIPDGVTKINRGAFSNFSHLLKVLRPALFNMRPPFLKILIALLPDEFVDSENIDFQNFKISVGDMLVIISRSRKSVIFLSKVIFQALYGCRLPEKVIIPNSVTEISDHAFSDFGNLKNIIIPGSVTCIDDYAFSLCVQIT
jgi:hypothetical protein